MKIRNRIFIYNTVMVLVSSLNDRRVKALRIALALIPTPRKVAPEKLKTVLRHPIRSA